MNGTNDKLLATSMGILYGTETEFKIIFGIGLLALFTNPLIMWTIWRQKSLHTGCFFIIAQLALADFFVGAAFTGTMIKRFIRIGGYMGEIFSRLQCTFEMTPNYFGESASLSFALALGCERLLAAAMPMKFFVYQWKIARIVSVVAWSIPVLDCLAMLIVMSFSPSKMIIFCMTQAAVTEDFELVQQIEKDFLIVAIIITYTLVLLTINIQLKAAKQQNHHSVSVMKKNLQLKMVRLVMAVAVMYLCLQMAPRIVNIIIAKLPQEQKIKIGAYARMLMALNSGIHFFVYLRDQKIPKYSYHFNWYDSLMSNLSHLYRNNYGIGMIKDKQQDDVSCAEINGLYSNHACSV